MKLPDLQMLAHWLDPALVATVETRRRKKKNGSGAVSWQHCKLCG